MVTQNKAIKGPQYQQNPGRGGGYWHCPIGDINFEDFNSLYIFGNEADIEAPDIYTGFKKDSYRLNGIVQKFTTRISPITELGNIIKYIDNGKKVPEHMYFTNKALRLEAYYDEATIKEAWTNSSLFIMNNEAATGGGIGSNANSDIPGHPKENKIIIEKKWDKSVPEDKIPKSIWVDLYIGDKKYAEVELGKRITGRISLKIYLSHLKNLQN